MAIFRIAKAFNLHRDGEHKINFINLLNRLDI
jgi:hypothetical protein